MGVEDEDIHPVEPPKRLDRCRAGVAAGGAHDGHTGVRAGQDRFEHLADKLHREVLERERRPMEQLQQKVPGCEFHQRRAGRVAEPCIGLRDQVAERILVKAIADERAHDAKGDLFVGQGRKRGDLLGR